MGSVRLCVLILLTMSGSKGELVTLEGYDLVFKPANWEAPRALLVNEKGNPVESFATDAFTACLFAHLESYKGLTDVFLFSLSSQFVVMRLDYLNNQTSLYIGAQSISINVVPPLDEWTHICVSWESRGGRVNLHVNGVRVGNGGSVLSGYILGGDEGYLVLGQGQDSFKGDFYPDSGVHGKITEFNLWNRVLTTNEVKEVQTCKLKGNVVNWSDAYWSLEGSLYKQKSAHPCGTSISQGCDCVKSAMEKFQNLLQTYKDELEDKLNNTAQTINDIEKTDGKAEQAIAELTQHMASNKNDITSLKNVTLGLDQRSTKNERDICHQKQAIDECGQRVSSLDQNLKIEITQQKQAIDTFGQRVNSLDQNLKSEISQQKQAIDAFGQRVSSLDQNLKSEIEAFGQRLSSLEQSLRSEISSLIAVMNTTLLTCDQQLSAAANSSRTDQAKPCCPTDFKLIHDYCYYFSPEIMNNWDEAMSLCQKLDPRATLANFETETEWEFMKTYLLEEKLTDKNWWIGGSDRDSEGNWTWMGSNQPLAYTSAWCFPQPDNAGGQENCLHIWQGTNPPCWNDLTCDRSVLQLYFICEI